MDSLFKELLTTGGPLGVLVVVVFLFLKDRKETSNSVITAMTNMHSEHLLARKETRDSVDKNTAAMTQNTVAVQTLAELMRKQNDRT